MSLATAYLPPVLGAATTIAVLGAEARRLPAQNVVALGLLAVGSAIGLEASTLLWQPFDLLRSLANTALTGASLVASRPLARLPGPGPRHLFVRTILAALALGGLCRWPEGGRVFPTVVTSLIGIPVTLLLLAPWWINKRLAPASTPEWAGLAGPALILGLATSELLTGNLVKAGIHTLAGSAIAIWAIRSLGRPAADAAAAPRA